MNRTLVNQKVFFVAISRTSHRVALTTNDGRTLPTHPEHDNGKRVSALDAVAATATAKAIFRFAVGAAHPANVAQAAGQNAHEEIEHSPGAGAQLERK